MYSSLRWRHPLGINEQQSPLHRLSRSRSMPLRGQHFSRLSPFSPIGSPRRTSSRKRFRRRTRRSSYEKERNQALRQQRRKSCVEGAGDAASIVFARLCAAFLVHRANCVTHERERKAAGFSATLSPTVVNSRHTLTLAAAALTSSAPKQVLEHVRRVHGPRLHRSVHGHRRGSRGCLARHAARVLHGGWVVCPPLFSPPSSARLG